MFSYYPFFCVLLLPVHQGAVPVEKEPNRHQRLLCRVPVKVKLSLKSKHKIVNGNTVQLKLRKRLCVSEEDTVLGDFIVQ